MTPQELAYAIQGMSDEQLAKLPHWMLYQAREHLPQADQDRIAGFEHRAFARESVNENPMMALPVAVGTLAYQPYKMFTGQSRSGASWDQMEQGLKGVYEGLTKPPPVAITPQSL